MKPREKKPEIVYRIIQRGDHGFSKAGYAVGSYSRTCCDEYDFGSAETARQANCHGEFEDKDKYAIAKYRVTYELLDDDVRS